MLERLPLRPAPLSPLFRAMAVLPLVCATLSAQGIRTAAGDTTARDTTARDTTAHRLAPVVVTAVTRGGARSPLDLPYAITMVRPDSMRPGQLHTQLSETLLGLPGVTIANRNNPTQDPRLSIRGFGARSAFGVRGVRVLRDGMPLTLPDGSTPVDYLDLESVGRVDVIRGSAASLYGNASGGVIDLRTAPPPTDAFAMQLRGFGGSNVLRREAAIFGGTDPGIAFQGDVTHTTNNGFRRYADQEVTSGYGRALFDVGRTHLTAQILAFDMPVAQNPGALTLSEVDTAPQMADPFSVKKHARKAVRQIQVGLSARHALGRGEVSALIYGGGRSLDNPLTYAIVGIGRVSGGGNVNASFPVEFLGRENRLTAGVDLAEQNDLRRNYANCNGLSGPTASCPAGTGERGALSVDQREIVSSVGPFLRDEITLVPRLRLSLGARADYVRFLVKDRLHADTTAADLSPVTMHKLSPMAGLVGRVTRTTSAYANVSTAFETPTTTELDTRPDSAIGLNHALQPQRSTTYELGYKGLVFSRLFYDVAGFDTEVRDELIPYQVPGGNGRTYYRNAGRTRRRGLEVGLTADLGALEVGASYTYSHFRFTDFQVGSAQYAGNTIPGIPSNQLQGDVTWRGHDLYTTLEAVTQSRQFVNDANSASVAGYTVVNLRLGGTAIMGRPWFSPVVGIDNLFDRHYIGSVSVNASLGKYYEPAPGRTFYAGLTAALGR